MSKKASLKCAADNIRGAMDWLEELPDGDDHGAISDSLEEALTAAESWLLVFDDAPDA